MTVSLGRVEAELAEPNQETPTKLVDLINEKVKPPTRVSADDVFIRAMYVVSDQVNSFGGRFPVEEHQGLAELLVDSPVLVGHRKDQLPVGRTFHAVTIERDGRPWVKSYFYWLRSAQRAEEFRANLDGGIYKECSIAFLFHLPECSICGKDIRRCQHQPFEAYDRSGLAERCHFNYRRIERVLETSLVYRGAVPDTVVVKDLSDAVSVDTIPLTSLADVEQDTEYLVVPRYDGLPVAASVSNGRLIMADLSGSVLKTEEEFELSGFCPKTPLLGVLVGQRGKARCSLKHLEDYLHGQTSPVSRLVLNLYPHQGVVTLPQLRSRSSFEIRIIPYRVVDRDRLDRAAREIMTRDGVEIRPLSQCGLAMAAGATPGFRYQPSIRDRVRATSADITMSFGDGNGRVTIRTGHESGVAGSTIALDLDAFNLAGLASGQRFLGRSVESSSKGISGTETLRSNLVKLAREGEGLVFEATGELAGRYCIRPIRLNGEERHLFGRHSDRAVAGGLR